jgi:hypothetical protein
MPSQNDVKQKVGTPVPAFLTTPPGATVKPPLVPTTHELPFEQLPWEDFEKLCLRLVRLEADVEHCQLYGTKGQKQDGIDIFARLSQSSGYAVYQCKRVTDFGASDIERLSWGF